MVSGSGLKPVTRKILRKLTYTVNLPLSKKGKAALKRKGALKTRLTLKYKPTNGPRTIRSTSKAVTIRRSR